MYRSELVDNVKIQYDQKAKQVASDKGLLAYILINAIDEFNGMSVEEVEGLIEPGPSDYLQSDESDAHITGLGNESAENDDDKIIFDLLFYVQTKEGRAQIIINLELQKNQPSSYGILNRAIFYACRMISTQKSREFLGSDFDSIKKIYTIWVCMNVSGMSLSHIHLDQDMLMGLRSGKVDLIY